MQACQLFGVKSITKISYANFNTTLLVPLVQTAQGFFNFYKK